MQADSERVERELYRYRTRKTMQKAAWGLLLVGASSWIIAGLLNEAGLMLGPSFFAAAVAALFIMLWQKGNLLPITAILYQDCAPYTAAEILSRLAEQEGPKKKLLFLLAGQAIGLTGDTQGARRYLMQNLEQAYRCGKLKGRLRIFYLGLLAENSEQDKDYLIQLKEQLRACPGQAAAQKRFALQAQANIDEKIALLDGDWDAARRLAQQALKSSSFPFQKVSLHADLARCDEAQGKKQEAAAHWRFVLQHGGTLRQTAQARKQLGEH